MEMGPRKLYVDSRKQVSGTHNDFDDQLPNPIHVPKCICFVDNAHFTNVFPTITNYSRFIYIEEISTANVSTKRKVGLTVKQNQDGTTLATEVALQLNAGTTLAANSYSCTFSSGTGKLTISNTLTSPADFNIWAADYLKHGLWNPLAPKQWKNYGYTTSDKHFAFRKPRVQQKTGRPTSHFAGLSLQQFICRFRPSPAGLSLIKFADVARRN